ncbi:MAG: urease accessory protein UreD [Burkholderiaceae bacterium]
MSAIVEAARPRDADAGWRARLALRFATRGDTTVLADNRHHGPLRLIRALPLADGRCQAVIVHPPGGLVGGDTLELDVELEPRARVLCTTPGAQKWYRSAAGPARARTRIVLGDDAALEWLPQPAIVYDAARVDQTIAFELAPSARMIGWEALILGRAAMGERFATGALHQRLSLTVGGVARWAERVAADAGDRLFASPLGWSGRTVSCTVWAVAPAAVIDDTLRDAWREVLAQACADAAGRGARLIAGASRPTPGLLAARLLADDSEVAMRAAQALWTRARPGVLGAGSAAPRIWAT